MCKNDILQWKMLFAHHSVILGLNARDCGVAGQLLEHICREMAGKGIDTFDPFPSLPRMH